MRESGKKEGQRTIRLQGQDAGPFRHRESKDELIIAVLRKQNVTARKKVRLEPLIDDGTYFFSRCMKRRTVGKWHANKKYQEEDPFTSNAVIDILTVR